MRGMGGWVGGSPRAFQVRDVLDAMLDVDPSCDAQSVPIRLSSTGCVGVHTGVVPAELFCSGALTAAVDGRVRWTDGEMSTIAAKEGNAAALAAAYRRDGDECLRVMRGAFAAAVIDDANGAALLAVDRMGIRSLCYAQAGDLLVFGTTATCVAAHPAVGRRLSHQAIFNYLYCHVVPSPGTIFDSVSKLRPGEAVSVGRGGLKRWFYWHLAYRDDSSEAPAEQQVQFRDLLRASARRAIDGETNVGAFLSGGTDSSTVAGLLTELAEKPAKTFSIGFRADGFDEMSYARIAARHFGSEAYEHYVTPDDVVATLPIIANEYDEPFGNASAAPTYLCARMANTHGVKVMLAGDGGDELFGGNARYARQKVFESYHRIPSGLRRRAIEPLSFGLPGGDRIAPLRKLRSYIEQAKVPLPDRLETYNFLHRAALEEVFEPGFLAEIDAGQPLELLREVYARTDSASAINRMMHLDLQITLADNDLRKVSRMCEAAGVEVRYPLLDDALVEFSGRIPPSLKVNRLQLRYFFKEALRDFLPAEILSKTKHGFGLPFGLWLREHAPLSDLARDSLDAFGRRGIVRPAYMESLFRSHAEEHATYFGVMIWVIMVLELWLQAHRS